MKTSWHILGELLADISLQRSGDMSGDPADTIRTAIELAESQEGNEWKEILIALREKLNTPVYDKPLSQEVHVELLTVQQWFNACRNNSLIDHDGFGHPVKDDMISEEVTLIPSESYNLPLDATHVIWYNR